MNDLTGLFFEKLFVLSFDRKEKYKRFWWVQCSCGSDVFSVREDCLKYGKTKSCGCTRVNNLKDKKFGNLIVIERDEDYISPQNKHYPKWICRCNCGNNISVKANDLLRGRTISCGCQRESLIASKLKEYFKKNYNAFPEYSIKQNGKTFRYDIYIPENVYIEINGIQHYALHNWHKLLSIRYNTTPEKVLTEQRSRDRIKKNYARKNGIYIEIDLRKIKTIEEAIQYIEKRLT